MAGLLCLAACGTTATTETDPPTDPANEETDNAGNNVETPDWPKKNITIVVGYSAGGDTDLAARVLADAMSRKLGVSVIVENLAGGSGVVGRTDLISNPGDGYTLMFDQPGSPITQVLLGNTTYTIEEGGTPCGSRRYLPLRPVCCR